MKYNLNILFFFFKSSYDDLIYNNLTYVKPPANWDEYSGFVTEQMVSELFPSDASDVFVATCGPKPMNDLVIGIYKKLGYPQDHVYRF